MNISIPEIEPRIVSGFLGIPGSRLPKETLATVGQATKPPVRRGGKGLYSLLDVLCMRLGNMLLSYGLGTIRTRESISMVREWIRTCLEDPLWGSPGFDTEKTWRWLVARQSEGGFVVELTDKAGLFAATITEKSADPHLIVNVHQFITRELERFETFRKANRD